MRDICNSVAAKMWRYFQLWWDKCEGHFQLRCGTNVFSCNFVAEQKWRTFSNLWREKCGGHLQLCGGIGMGNIFYFVDGQMWGIFSTQGTNVGDIFNSLSGHFELCGLTKARYIFNTGWTNVRDILNFVPGKIWGTFTTVWWDKCGGHLELYGWTNVGGCIFNSVA